LDWNCFTDTLLCTNVIEDGIYIVVMDLHPVHFKRLLSLVKEGKAFERLHGSGRYNVTLTYEDPYWPEDTWKTTLEDVITSTRKVVDIDGHTVELDPLEQFELWQRRDNKAGKESYLRGLMPMTG
jgi:hypothetical protein